MRGNQIRWLGHKVRGNSETFAHRETRAKRRGRSRLKWLEELEDILKKIGIKNQLNLVSLLPQLNNLVNLFGQKPRLTNGSFCHICQKL